MKNKEHYSTSDQTGLLIGTLIPIIILIIAAICIGYKLFSTK
jgi:hypothetical protein